MCIWKSETTVKPLSRDNCLTVLELILKHVQRAGAGQETNILINLCSAIGLVCLPLQRNIHSGRVVMSTVAFKKLIR